jgi:uncharacterized protein (DUF433 family)
MVETNPEILDGLLVFAGTRVPVQALIDHLEGGERLDDFLDDYPTVSRAQAVAALNIARHVVSDAAMSQVASPGPGCAGR